MVNPIKPDEVKKARKFPDAVIESFNELIGENFDGKRASFKQRDVVKRIVAKGISKKEIEDNNWLDVEPIYISAGWDVSYNKPAYNEDGEPTFTFEA
jgi:hypothetical protein